jgi:pyrimidine-nucleoside phosphorylase
MMDIRTILTTKRDGRALSEEEIRFFIDGYVAGEIPDYQASALLMAIFIQGMERRELTTWTHAMLHSGRIMRFEGLGRPTSDKHSTGGIGDKVSIALAPAVAACGVAVPMISGRGLGHTGGTLDKLESIPGFRTDLSEREFTEALEEVGVALGAQTEDLVPADRKLYALRDVTGLVPSIPLIASSIMSKKLAEGAQSLVLDVKYGSGAFLTDPDQGRELGQVMIDLAHGMGVQARVLQTAMDRPLGRAVGHTLEILECLDCLRGEGPADLRELCCALAGEMLVMADVSPNLDDGKARIARVLDDGSAYECFERICAQQGGIPGRWFDEAGDPDRTDREELVADRSGFLRFGDLKQVGFALVELGGGRIRLEDEIDFGVGFRWHRDAGEKVTVGESIATVHHRGGRGLESARALLGQAIVIDEEFQPEPLILARL